MLRTALRDDQWVRIENLLQGKAGDRGRRGVNNRLFVEAVLWVARTGNPWRDLPTEFGSWNSTYVRLARWADKNAWHNIFAVLREDADFEEIFVDRTIVRAHQHAAGAAKKKGADSGTFSRRFNDEDSCLCRRTWPVGDRVKLSQLS